MGKKKPTDPGANTETDAVSSQPDIFTTLFGDVKDKTTVVSIFSDANPFVRKPQDQQTLEPSRSPDNGGAQDPDVTEKKSRKRKNEKKATPGGLDSDDEAPEAQKSKKGKLKSADLEYGDGEDMAKEKENKRKRKRDEIEKEYEARKYGDVDDIAGDGDKRFSGRVGEKRKTVDNPSESLVPREGFDDESKLLRTVFVGNLPLAVKKKALIKEFSKFGEVESVRIRPKRLGKEL